MTVKSHRVFCYIQYPLNMQLHKQHSPNIKARGTNMSKNFNINRNALFDILLILSFRLSYLDSKGMNNIERMSSKMSSICFLLFKHHL